MQGDAVRTTSNGGRRDEEVAEELCGGAEVAAARRDNRGGTETWRDGARDCGLLQRQWASAHAGGVEETTTTSQAMSWLRG